MTRKEEIAWAAGLFEGEGCCCVRASRNVQLQLGTTDEDVAKTFFRIVGVGTLNRYHAPSHRALGRKPTWMWRCGAKADIVHVADLFLLYMHERRGAEMRRSVEATCA